MIICIGESLIDFVPQEDRRARAAGSDSGAVDRAAGDGGGPAASATALPLYRPVAGGCPYNCSISAARLGADVAFAGTVSTDFFGDQIVGRLRANRVGLDLVSRVDAPTTLAFVKKAADGSARYAFFTNGAADRTLSPGHIPLPLPGKAILQMGSISIIPDPEGTTILELAEAEHGDRIVAFDPNVRETLASDHADYRARIERALAATSLLKASDEDLAWIYPDRSFDEALARVLELGVRLVVVTRGAEGSDAITAADRVHVDAEKVEVSDTIGAGDSFLAALLVWLDEHGILDDQALGELGGEELADVLGFASKVSAITCTRVGADPPYRDQLVGR
ncbi:MAG: carbohydrate kinase family protein [Spirochaetota bacterium]